MKKYLYLIVVVYAVLSCSDENVNQEVVFVEEENAISEEAEHELKSDEIDFADFYYKFSATIESTNYQMFNDFIYSDYGCYVIESSGAMPSLTSVYDVGEFVSRAEGQRFFDIPFIEIDQVILFETLPKIVCDAQIYDKLGCFATQSGDFRNSQIWRYAGLSEEEIAEVEALVETVNITVVNTYNYTFHFSKIESKWYVSFIDMRVPCSA